MRKQLFTSFVLFSFLSLLIGGYTAASSAIILPGFHEPGTDLKGTPLSSQNVIDWELNNSALVFGHYANPEHNKKTQTIGYMYNQKLELNGGWLENNLRNKAERFGIDYEDFFLHFAEDTLLAEVDPSHGTDTILHQKPVITGYTVNPDHAGFWLYQDPPWDVDVFEHSHQGGGLYIYHTELFDRLTFTFSRPATEGYFTIEYPSAINEQGQITKWQLFEIKADETDNMTKSETVSWHMPTNWQRGTTHDGSGASYGGGQYFGSTLIRDGGRLYTVRVRWYGDETGGRPWLQNVKLKESFAVIDSAELPIAPVMTENGSVIKRWRQILGFDHTADINKDNYLSDEEYENRANKNASARFRWESRVIPFGRMWNERSSWALTHLAREEYLLTITDYYYDEWQEQGLKGAYNDDTAKLLGANQFTIYSGGMIHELGVVAGSDAADKRYKAQFSRFLKAISALDDNAVVGLNIGTANLYGRNGQSHLLEAGSLYLREHYIVPSTGFSGYTGIAKFWDNSALAHAGRSVIYQATVREGRVQYFGNTEQSWRQDQYAALAIYYLNYQPGYSYFNQWDKSYFYGSGNTTANNFWKSGVAKNIAYQPTELLAVDLGEPVGKIPSGYEPIPLMLSTHTPYPADYSIVGDSTMAKVTHADLPNGATHLLPTYTYFLHRSEHNIITGGPEEMVLAREFDKGRVVYRTDFFGKIPAFYNSPKLAIKLDVPMRPVDPYGNIGDYVNEIAIGGYEGLFLLY